VAHNSYLSVLVEEGFVGFLLYITMFIAVFLALMRLPTMERRFALVLFATICVAMLPLSWDDRKSVWFVLAGIVGLVTARYTPAFAYRQPAPYESAPVFRGSAAGRPRQPMAVPNIRRGTTQ
jgi:O-antigen ligase